MAPRSNLDGRGCGSTAKSFRASSLIGCRQAPIGPAEHGHHHADGAESGPAATASTVTCPSARHDHQPPPRSTGPITRVTAFPSTRCDVETDLPLSREIHPARFSLLPRQKSRLRRSWSSPMHLEDPAGPSRRLPDLRHGTRGCGAIGRGLQPRARRYVASVSARRSQCLRSCWPFFVRGWRSLR
jgi:hypothetical protein